MGRERVNVLQALERANRLEKMGVTVRSPELAGEAQRIREFYARGGNRAMRRARKKKRR